MNIKKGILFLPLLLSALLLTPRMASAAEKDYVPITGTAYGDKIGLLHFDSRTASPTLAINSDNVQYVGPTKQYYNPALIATGKNPGFPIDSDDSLQAGISTTSEACPVDPITGKSYSCLLRGFIWSDTIGWIALDGPAINEAVNTSIPGWDTANDDNPVLDPYTSDMFPRISKVGAKAVPLIGMGWNRHTGWIRLSYRLDIGTTTLTDSQTATDWGAWLDTDTPTLYLGPEKEELGHKLHGFVWSEKLGWIKLGAEGGDEIAFQAYTTWAPDESAPIVLTPNRVWFSVGVNTGYKSDATEDEPYTKDPGVVVWRGFTLDPQSNINTGQSKFFLKPDDTIDPNCSTYLSANIAVQDPMNTLKARSATVDGKTVSFYDLSIPGLGNVPATEKGYCKFIMSAKIYNGANMITYIGPDYLTNPIPKPNSVQLDAITVLVRAGNVDIGKTEVNPVNSPTLLGDGNQRFGYTVQLEDVNGNRIQSIDCSDLYVGCPERRVKIEPDITNELLFDLTESAPLPPYTTPLIKSDYASGGAQTYVATDTGLEVNWDSINKIHSIFFASFAPNETYVSSTNPTQTLPFLVNKFKYTIQNLDQLPPISKKIDLPFNPDSPSLSDDLDTGVPVYALDDTIVDPNQFLVDSQLDKLDPNPVLALGSKPGWIMPSEAGFNTPTPSGSPSVATIRFKAPIVADSNPDLTSGTLSNVLTVGSPADLKTSLSNLSPTQTILNAELTGDKGGLSMDNIITFVSSTSSSTVAIVDTQRIKVVDGDPANDAHFAWADPIEGQTRYELLDKTGQCFNQIGDLVPCDAQNSPFHKLYEHFHPGKDFCYDVKTTVPTDFCMDSPDDADYPVKNSLNDDGNYMISGSFSIPEEYAKDAVSGVWPSGVIDRNDSAPMAMYNYVNPADPTHSNTVPLHLRFTPQKIVSSNITSIQLKLLHDIAYRYPAQILNAVYTSNPVSNFDVKDIGIEAKGTVVGERLTTGRKFDTVGTASTKKLQEQIRRNVAQLTSGTKVVGNCPIPSEPVVSFEDINTGDCYLNDAVNQTAVRYFEGAPDQTLILGDGSDTPIVVPPTPYTIIVKGGANLFIRNNIKYKEDAARSALGLILIATEIGKGANVYISPTPTNLVGTLYAEGSLMSRGGEDGTKDYYGGGTGDVQDLRNQLYWQGSIASRNTIAGAGIKKRPDGTQCLPGDTDLECAQRYDLDYLRRFTAVVDVANGTSAVANNGKFSGGGCCGTTDCNASDGTCVLPDPLALPTIVTLTSGQIDKGNSELSTFYIEPGKQASIAPPGFTLTTGQETTQTIR